MTATKYLDRVIPQISLANFESRIDEITLELVNAAENIGFFSIIEHGIRSEVVQTMFEDSARFFSQHDTVKAKVPFSVVDNAGWEKNAQIRPSTGRQTGRNLTRCNSAKVWMAAGSLRRVFQASRRHH